MTSAVRAITARAHLNGLAIDLYESSSLTVACGDQRVGLRIKTGYPFENSVSIELTPERPAGFPLHMRCPGWADEMIALPPRKGSLTPQRE